MPAERSKTVFMTGASSGIGYALASELARRGYDLALTARRGEVLTELKNTIESRFPQRKVWVRALDVHNYDLLRTALTDAHQDCAGLDIVIANAGIGSGGHAGTGNFDADRQVIETNVIAAMATIDAAVGLFKAQGRGQIVAISSVAAFRGLPKSASYSASKAAIATYAEGIRCDLHGTQIRMTTLFPGFIDTPINQSLKSRPFVIPVDKGARLIADLIERRVNTSTVPVFPWNVISWLMRLAPVGILAKTAG